VNGTSVLKNVPLTWQVKEKCGVPVWSQLLQLLNSDKALSVGSDGGNDASAATINANVDGCSGSTLAIVELEDKKLLIDYLASSPRMLQTAGGGGARKESGLEAPASAGSRREVLCLALSSAHDCFAAVGVPGSLSSGGTAVTFTG
jgi:hypothetical protein